MLEKHKNKIKIIVFCAIFCLIQAPVFLSGELMPTRLVIATQDYIGEDFLYSKAHTEDTSYYKQIVTDQRGAEVLAIGTSRVLQIQGFFFEEDTSFYNAGLIASNLPDILLALQSMEEDSLPDVAILSLDEYFFNEEWYAENDGGLFPQEPVTGLELYTAAAIGIYEEICRTPEFYLTLCQSPCKIGTGAKGFDHGYGLDGAYTYGSVYAAPAATSVRIKETVDNVKYAAGRYHTGDTVSSDALDTLREIAVFCQEHDITLVTLTPPLCTSAIEEMEERGDMGYFFQIADAVSAVAAEEGFEFYNVSDPAILDADDDYFIDGFHGSDVLYLRMLIQMVRQGSCLSAYVSLDDLTIMNENALSTLQVQ